MQDSIISWTNQTWNPTSGCSRVSDGCKFCYAATLSQMRGWTTKPWTIQNEAENVVVKPHKLKEPYLLKEPARVFVNSMSDLFHRAISDVYRAAVFCVMLDLNQHTFQILTKRPEGAIDWHVRFAIALASEEFRALRESIKDKRVKAAMETKWLSPWGQNIWMGTSVEDSRVLNRIDHLRRVPAQTRFISAEPLLGAWGTDVDLSNIHWLIVGGESGLHLKENPERWMKMEWAREIRDLCAAQGVVYFFKQDSGLRTEERPYLVEADGTHTTIQEYPNKDAQHVPPPPKSTTTVVNFHDVKHHWDATTKMWDSPDLIYVGRANKFYKLPASPWANPFKWEQGQPDALREAAIEQYRAYIRQQLGVLDIEDLRGKKLVCWCSPMPCHADILLEMLGETPPPRLPKPKVSTETPEQLALF